MKNSTFEIDQQKWYGLSDFISTAAWYFKTYFIELFIGISAIVVIINFIQNYFGL